MVNIYCANDSGAEIDPFWGTAVTPSSRFMNQEEVLVELKKSFHKNATKLDFITTQNGITYVLGKIGTNEQNTEYRVWKSINGMFDVDCCEDIGSCVDESEAIKLFWGLAGESYRVYCKTQNNGLGHVVVGSDVTDRQIEAEEIQTSDDILIQMLLNDFARNANKVDYCPVDTGEVVVIGFIGKSVDDEKSIFRVWKSVDHFKNENVQYITGKINKEQAYNEFRKAIG